MSTSPLTLTPSTLTPSTPSTSTPAYTGTGGKRKVNNALKAWLNLLKRFKKKKKLLSMVMLFIARLFVKKREKNG